MKPEIEPQAATMAEEAVLLLAQSVVSMAKLTAADHVSALLMPSEEIKELEGIDELSELGGWIRLEEELSDWMRQLLRDRAMKTERTMRAAGEDPAKLSGALPYGMLPS